MGMTCSHFWPKGSSQRIVSRSARNDVSRRAADWMARIEGQKKGLGRALVARSSSCLCSRRSIVTLSVEASGLCRGVSVDILQGMSGEERERNLVIGI